MYPLISQFNNLKVGFADFEESPNGDFSLNFYIKSEPSVLKKIAPVKVDNNPDGQANTTNIYGNNFSIQTFSDNKNKVILLQQEIKNKKSYQDISGFAYQHPELGTFIITSLNAHSGAALYLSEYILSLNLTGPDQFVLITEINKFAAEIYTSATRFKITNEGIAEIELSEEKKDWIPKALIETNLVESFSYTKFGRRLSTKDLF